LLGYFPGDKGEHPYSWLDTSVPTAISADGKTLSFFEGGRFGPSQVMTNAISAPRMGLLP